MADQILLGAVGIEVQQTAEVWANVNDYGAKGNLSVSDGAAIQAALGNHPFVVPPGNYRIDETLNV